MITHTVALSQILPDIACLSQPTTLLNTALPASSAVRVQNDFISHGFSCNENLGDQNKLQNDQDGFRPSHKSISNNNGAVASFFITGFAE